MVKCVIFDMDGTIADTLPLCIAAFRDAIESVAGVELCDREIIDTFGPSEEGTIQQLLPNDFSEGMRRYLSSYQQLHPVLCPKPFPGMQELMEAIRSSGRSLALVTGKGAKSLAITLRQFAMQNSFDAIETGRPQGPSKPQGIRRVLDTLHIVPQQAVYVGDAPSDILAARQVAVPVVAAAWAATTNREELSRQNPDRLCDSVEELRKYLLAARID